MFLVIHNEEQVYIKSVDDNDSGLYECIISNGYHSSISRSFYVTVQCKFYLHDKFFAKLQVNWDERGKERERRKSPSVGCVDHTT